jgi:hypothetical protein
LHFTESSTRWQHQLKASIYYRLTEKRLTGIAPFSPYSWISNRTSEAVQKVENYNLQTDPGSSKSGIPNLFLNGDTLDKTSAIP